MDNDVGRLTDVIMSAGRGVKGREASLEMIQHLSALQRTRSRAKPITPQQKARITTVACVGAAAAAKTTGGKAMAECMDEAYVKVIWLPESATQCLSEMWDNQYPEEDWEAYPNWPGVIRPY